MRYVYLRRKLNREEVNKPPGFVRKSTRKIMPEKFGGYPKD